MSGRIVLLCIATGVLGACGTFTLAHYQAPAGRTADQQQLDQLTCKDKAHDAALTAGQQTKEFLLGLTIIGTPFAFESDKAKQRKVFAQCMREKGYAVTPADD